MPDKLNIDQGEDQLLQMYDLVNLYVRIVELVLPDHRETG